jgi:hypothetical protein
MNLADLGILYASAGVVSGVCVYRRARSRGASAWGSVALAVPLWPLWLPVAFAEGPRRSQAAAPAVTRTEAALLEGHDAVRGGPLERLLPREAIERIVAEVRRAAERHDELTRVLSRDGFGVEAARARLARFEQDAGPSRSIASARLQLANLERLSQLRERDARALEELAELAGALRTQLVLARYTGSSATGASDIVAEVWARVEVLGSALEPVDELCLNTS